MYEMAKKAREAMRGKAKRMAGEKDSKVDSSDFTPAPMLNADVKTGMRPISKQGFKRGGKIAGAKAEVHAGRKPRKSGGRAITADSLINRDQKEANEGREGKKHIGGMKKGGRAEKAMGGSPTDMLKTGMNPQAYIKNVLGPTMGLKKGGKIGKSNGGTLERIKNPNPSPDYQPSKPDPDYKVEGGPSDKDKDDLTKKIEGLKKGGRTGRKAGGNVNYGPMEMPAGKKGMSTSEQVALEKKQDAASKPTRGKAVNKEGGGGLAPYGTTAPVPAVGPDPKSIVRETAMDFGAGTSGSPYVKRGGAIKHEDVAEDKALIKKMVKPEARSGKNVGGMSGAAGKDDGGDSYNPRYLGSAQREAPFKDTSAGAEMREAGEEAGRRMKGRTLMRGAPEDMAQPRKGGGRTAKFGGGGLSAPKKGGKGKTNINIVINPGKPDDQMGGAPGMPPMPPGLPPRPAGGIPVPMGMPPAGGAAPMPMPMPSAPAPTGMPPMGRKAGGKVYKSYKDMDAGAGSGLGRLEKTEIQKRKA
jgi:hypothetical protein